MILFSNPKINYLKHKKIIDQKLKATLKSGSYISSKEVKKFEDNFSKYLKVDNCIGVGNATDAIYLSLKSIGIGKGDEVLTPSHTATGTVLAIINTGAKPIFVDIDEKNYNLNLDLIPKLITTKTKAMVIVHLYGQACNMEKAIYYSKKYKIPIIEDCSQAAGARYKNFKVGSIGLLGCFSFFPTKNLGTYGDGGLVSTNNNRLAAKVRSLKEYGWDKKRNTVNIGINSRLDELHASILNVKLKYLDRDNTERQKIAQIYNSEIVNKKIIKPLSDNNINHVYHLYVIRTKKREKLLKIFKDNKIICGIHYKLPVHRQEVFKKFNKSSLKITEKISKQIISLPMYPGLKYKDQKKVINILNNFKDF